jgi:hypothetical protein
MYVEVLLSGSCVLVQDVDIHIYVCVCLVWTQLGCYDRVCRMCVLGSSHYVCGNALELFLGCSCKVLISTSMCFMCVLDLLSVLESTTPQHTY